MTWLPGRAGIGEGLLRTQVGDKLLGNVHPAEQLLQEAKGEPFLNGRCIQLHVLKASAWMGGGKDQLRPRMPCFPSFSSSDSAPPGLASSSFCLTPGPWSFPLLPWTRAASYPKSHPLNTPPGSTPFAKLHPLSFLPPLWSRLCSPDPALLASSLFGPVSPTLACSPSCCPVGSASLAHCSQVWLPAHAPGDCIAIHLQELQQLLGLLSISCLLLGSESVVGDQQRVGPTTWRGQDQKSGGREGPRPLSFEVVPAVEGSYNY